MFKTTNQIIVIDISAINYKSHMIIEVTNKLSYPLVQPWKIIISNEEIH